MYVAAVKVRRVVIHKRKSQRAFLPLATKRVFAISQEAGIDPGSLVRQSVVDHSVRNTIALLPISLHALSHALSHGLSLAPGCRDDHSLCT